MQFTQDGICWRCAEEAYVLSRQKKKLDNDYEGFVKTVFVGSENIQKISFGFLLSIYDIVQ